MNILKNKHGFRNQQDTVRYMLDKVEAMEV